MSPEPQVPMELGGGGNPQQEQIDQLLEMLEMRLADPDSAHRPMVLSGEVDVKRLGANHSEMEFIAALRWSVEEVSRAFGGSRRCS